jgi:hypothetical protein
MGLYTNNDFLFLYGKEKKIIKDFFQLLKGNTIKTEFYCHNLSFDGSILLKIFLNLKIIKEIHVIQKENTIYQIKFEYNKTEFKFKCSYLYLKSSLSAISKKFEFQSKTELYYDFINENTIFYKGEYKNHIIDVEKDTIEYCKNDLIIQKKAFEYFEKKIFESFNISINNTTCLSSLSYKI